MNNLPRLFHHKWAMPILAEMHRRGGGRFVALTKVLGASQGSVRQTLGYLIAQGWIKKDEMYGHPLRPEYLLTEHGRNVGAVCVKLRAALDSEGLEEIAASKWAAALILQAADDPLRFSEFRSAFPEATDRSLSQALRLCVSSRAMCRSVDAEARPPTPWYGLEQIGMQIAPLLQDLNLVLELR